MLPVPAIRKGMDPVWVDPSLIVIGFQCRVLLDTGRHAKAAQPGDLVLHNLGTMTISISAWEFIMLYTSLTAPHWLAGLDTPIWKFSRVSWDLELFARCILTLSFASDGY